MTPATSTLRPTIMFGTLITPDIDVVLGMGYGSLVLGVSES